MRTRAVAFYGSVSACVTGVGCLTGETQFDKQMQQQTDYDTLLRLWTTWCVQCGLCKVVPSLQSSSLLRVQ